MTTKEWAEKNGLAEMYAEYEAECQLIADECMIEGYPSYGSTYDLRVEALRAEYPILFGDV